MPTKKHGESRSKLYHVWSSMRDRCTNPNCKAYRYYGGRGITVCERWLNSFAAFQEDVGKRLDGMTLDRINSNGNYEPNNVRWATMKTQQQNRRNNVYLTAFGETKIAGDWVIDERCAAPLGTLYRRVGVLGWDHQKAIETPINKARSEGNKIGRQKMHNQAKFMRPRKRGV
jgi:hypothetical protein